MNRAGLVALFPAGPDTPIYGSPEWEALPLADARRWASLIRAAECWRLDGEPEAVRRRLNEDDWLARFRVRQAGLDVHEAQDALGIGPGGKPWTWKRRAGLTPIAELQRLRAYKDGLA